VDEVAVLAELLERILGKMPYWMMPKYSKDATKAQKAARLKGKMYKKKPLGIHFTE